MTPFNFTSIAANLPTASAMMGNVVVWKPASTSVLSCLYVPSGLAPRFLERLGAEVSSIRMGPTTDFRNFMGAVIDEASFGTIMPYLRRACSASSASCALKLLSGGTGDKSAGYFIRPTLLLAEDPRYETMEKELFGPVLSACVYDESDMEAAYRLVDSTSPYGLTGAIIANDRQAIVRGLGALSTAPRGGQRRSPSVGPASRRRTNPRRQVYAGLRRLVRRADAGPVTTWRQGRCRRALHRADSPALLQPRCLRSAQSAGA